MDVIIPDTRTNTDVHCEWEISGHFKIGRCVNFIPNSRLSSQMNRLKIVGCYNANFIVTGGIAGGHNHDNIGIMMIIGFQWYLFWLLNLLHKSHNALVSHPTMHHFVTEIYTCVHILLQNEASCLTRPWLCDICLMYYGFMRWVWGSMVEPQNTLSAQMVNSVKRTFVSLVSTMICPQQAANYYLRHFPTPYDSLS